MERRTLFSLEFILSLCLCHINSITSSTISQYQSIQAQARFRIAIHAFISSSLSLNSLSKKTAADPNKDTESWTCRVRNTTAFQNMCMQNPKTFFSIAFMIWSIIGSLLTVPTNIAKHGEAASYTAQNWCSPGGVLIYKTR